MCYYSAVEEGYRALQGRSVGRISCEPCCYSRSAVDFEQLKMERNYLCVSCSVSFRFVLVGRKGAF